MLVRPKDGKPFLRSLKAEKLQRALRELFAAHGNAPPIN